MAILVSGIALCFTLALYTALLALTKRIEDVEQVERMRRVEEITNGTKTNTT